MIAAVRDVAEAYGVELQVRALPRRLMMAKQIYEISRKISASGIDSIKSTPITMHRHKCTKAE
jgi:hypothetical protein